MKYVLNIYQPDGPPPAPDVLAGIMRDVHAVVAELKTSGAWLFNAGLHPPSAATVVRAGAGELAITDGPYAEAKEHIGGFVIIEAADLDAALAWAGKLARATTLPIEVRPLQLHG